MKATEGAESRSSIGTAALWVGAAGVLVAPVFAAFRSGGFYQDTQLLIGIAACLLLALVAVLAPWPPLAGGLPLAALAALTAYAGWTALSTGWARILEYAVHDVHRVASYVAVFALALAVMRDRRVRRLAPEVLLAGVLVVSLYALAGRLLPHLVHERIISVRLSQPLTYWNALGMFAGFGVLLGVAVAGDRSRPLLWRSVACAAAVPCGLAAYLTLSRGVAASMVAGLVLCAVLRRGRATLVAAACALVPVVALALISGAFPDVVSADAGNTSQRASQGAAFLPIVLAATVAAGFAFARLTRAPLARGGSPFPPRPRAAIAIAVVPVVLAIAVYIAGQGTETSRLPSSASRITRVETARGHYWRVAAGAFGRHPLNGVGSGSFAAEWRKRRGHDQPALDAHSIYLETPAELGLVGALLLIAFLVAVGAGVVRGLRATPRNPTVIAATAVLGAYAVHLALDWDWEMPAVTLIPLTLAAAVLQPRDG